MSSRAGLSYLRQKAADLARFVCPLCEKITPEDDANLRARHGGSRDPWVVTRWLWTCKHCGATHRDGAERLIK